MKSDACAILIRTDTGRLEHLLSIPRSAEAHIPTNKIWKSLMISIGVFFPFAHQWFTNAGIVSQSSDPNLAVCVFLV